MFEEKKKNTLHCPSGANKAGHGERPAALVLESQWRQTAVTCTPAASLTCEIELRFKWADTHVRLVPVAKMCMLMSLMA